MSPTATNVDGNWSDEPNIVRSQFESYEILKGTFSELLASRIAAADPEKIALIQEPEGYQITYGQLHVQLQELAHTLANKFDVKKSDIKLLYGDNSLQYAVMIATAAYLGIASTSLPPANGPFEMIQQLRDSGASIMAMDHAKLPVFRKAMDSPDYCRDVATNVKLLVLLNSDNETRDQIRNHPNAPAKVLTFEELTEMGRGQRLDTIPMFPCKWNDEFLIVYTSGTTGKPKGAVHTQYSWMASIINNEKFDARFEKAGDGETKPPAIMTMPMGHVSGTYHVCSVLNSGRTGVVIANPSTDQICSLIQKYRTPILVSSPSLVVELANGDFEKRYDLSSLKMIFHGGSKVPGAASKEASKKFNALLVDSYGATEFLGGISPMYRLGNPDNIPGNIGNVSVNCQLKIVDLKTGKNLSVNETGEICLRGPMCFAGYRGNPEATKDTIDQNGWYHTGDIGFYDKNESVHIVDRIKEMIKYKGWTVIPVELEEFLHQHPAVLSCCVIGVKHLTDGQLPRAYVQLKPGTQATAEELQQLVKENLGFQKRLRGGVRFIENMPRTVIGKVDRKYFKQLVQDELITEPIE